VAGASAALTGAIPGGGCDGGVGRRGAADGVACPGGARLGARASRALSFLGAEVGRTWLPRAGPFCQRALAQASSPGVCHSDVRDGAAGPQQPPLPDKPLPFRPFQLCASSTPFAPFVPILPFDQDGAKPENQAPSSTAHALGMIFQGFVLEEGLHSLPLLRLEALTPATLPRKGGVVAPVPVLGC